MPEMLIWIMATSRVSTKSTKAIVLNTPFAKPHEQPKNTIRIE